MCVCVCVCARACEQERQLILGSQDHLVKVRTPFISYSVRLAAATPHTHCFSSAAFCVSAGDVNSAPSVPSGPPMDMGSCSYGRRPALSVVWDSVGGSSVNWLSIHTQTRTPIAKLSALMSWQVPAFWGYQTLPSQHWASTLILELAVHMSSVEWGGNQCGYNFKRRIFAIHPFTFPPPSQQWRGYGGQWSPVLHGSSLTRIIRRWTQLWQLDGRLLHLQQAQSWWLTCMQASATLIT